MVNTLGQLSLPDIVQKLIDNGTMTTGQAKPLIIIDSKDVDKLVNKVVKNSSARRIEKLVQDNKLPINNTPVISETAQENKKQLQHCFTDKSKGRQ